MFKPVYKTKVFHRVMTEYLFVGIVMIYTDIDYK